MGDGIFSEVRAEPLSELALRLVREAIVAGKLPPGQPINQADIAKQLGMSRAPLREALGQLEKEGLVTNVPFRGTMVTPLTAQGINELQSLRRVLETFAAALVLEHADDDAIDHLTDLVDDIARFAAIEDFTKLNLADVRFHTRIIELSDHELLLRVWETYVQQIRRAMTLRNLENRDLATLVKMHRDLVKAFQNRDMDAIRKCYENHGADLIEALEHFFVSPNGDKNESRSAFQ